MKAYR